MIKISDASYLRSKVAPDTLRTVKFAHLQCGYRHHEHA